MEAERAFSAQLRLGLPEQLSRHHILQKGLPLI